MALIVIDPGHGGSDPGNPGNSLGVDEKVHALDIGTRVADILNPNNSAHLTRRDDTLVPLERRPEIAKDLLADVFVSIHFNSAETCPAGNQNGTETYHHPNASVDSISLANSVQAAVTAVVGRSNRGVRQANFVVIRPTLHYQSTAACLVEVSFLCDAAEENKLSNATYRQRIAQAIADGVIAFNEDRNFRERESKSKN